MASIGGSVLTLTDWAKRQDPKGKTGMIVEILNQANEVLDDMLWKEGNLPTGERTIIRTGLPTTYWRMINQGVPSSKSTTAQVDESCGHLVAWSEVDEKLAKLNGDVNAFRLSEAKAFLEAMSQEMASTLFYGSAANPEEFVGFANRFNSTTANNGENIISAGSITGGDGASIWLVGWGENSVYGVFPKGSKAGVEHQDLGLTTVETTAGVAGNRMRAYQDYFTWDAGLVVKDWRYVSRIANIDISALAADGAGATVKLIEYMLKAVHRMPTMSGIKPVFYANRTVKEMLDIQSMNKANIYLNSGQEEGKLKTTFRGIPIRTVDALTQTESTVS